MRIYEAAAEDNIISVAEDEDNIRLIYSTVFEGPFEEFLDSLQSD